MLSETLEPVRSLSVGSTESDGTLPPTPAPMNVTAHMRSMPLANGSTSITLLTLTPPASIVSRSVSLVSTSPAESSTSIATVVAPRNVSRNEPESGAVPWRRTQMSTRRAPSSSTLLVICSSGTAPTYSVTETNVISRYASFDASYALHAVVSEHVELTQPTSTVTLFTLLSRMSSARTSERLAS